jgi:hypothetical protein
MTTQILEQASKLGIDEQMELVEVLWDGIVGQHTVPKLSEAMAISARIVDAEKNEPYRLRFNN